MINHDYEASEHCGRDCMHTWHPDPHCAVCGEPKDHHR